MHKKVGLALSGGAAWSIAGLGTLKILEENNIPIDFLAADSLGAIIFAAYASQFDGKNTINSIQQLLEKSSLWDTISINPNEPYGLFSADKIGENFEKAVGKLNFEDLKIPVSVVATDFKTGKEVVFNSGPLTPALCASASLPLLFAPYHYNNMLLTDGGASNPIPINVVKNMGADITIGIDVTAREHITHRNGTFNAKLSHHKYLGLIPGIEYMTNRHLMIAFSQIVDILVCNLKESRLKQYPPDVLLSPKVVSLGSLFSFEMTTEFVAEGEKETTKYLKTISNLLKTE